MTIDTHPRDVAGDAAQGSQLAASSSPGPLAQPQASSSASSHPSTSSAASPQAPRWSQAEDDTLKKGFELCGHNWRKTAAYFAKAAPQNIRSISALKNRYFCYLDGRSKEEKAASQKRRGQHRMGQRQMKGQQQQQMGSPAISRPAQGRNHSPASSSFPSSSSSFTTPPLPTMKPATSAGLAWTPGKEKQLLRLALHHQGQDCIATQARAIHEDFCSLYPSTAWSSEEVQEKVGQLMQSEFGEEGGGEEEGLQEDEEQLEEGEIREGESALDQRGEGAGGYQADSAIIGTTEGQGVDEACNAARATFKAHTAAVEEAEELEVAGPAWLAHSQGARALLSSERARLPPPTVSRPPREHSLRTAPLYPSATEPHATAQQLPTPALLDFDHDVRTLPYGLRFERLPPNGKVSIFSPSHYKIGRLAPYNAAAHALTEEGMQAAFVYHVVADRSVVAVKLPPRTQTHMEVVPLSVGEAGESEEGFVAESHWPAECGFKVVFATML